MRAANFLEKKTKAPSISPNEKLKFIQSKINSGEVTDPETIDFIFKILNKPEIQNTVASLLSNVQASDADVKRFQELNNNVLAKILMKMPLQKEQLDHFLQQWSKGTGFVNTELMVPGSRGSLTDLIPDPTAFKVFETLENIRTTYKLPKKGTTGYGEFGMSMLSPQVALKAPGDIEVNGSPIEVKGNDARLYADERTGAVKEAVGQFGEPEMMGQEPAKGEKKAAKPTRGAEPGLITNVVRNLAQGDQNAIQQASQAFTARGVSAADRLINQVIKLATKDEQAALDLLQKEWWRSGFTTYQKSIGMPIMVIGFGQFLISDRAEDFIEWGSLPRTAANFGYMYGRQAGQTRETYPKIFIPGHNK